MNKIAFLDNLLKQILTDLSTHDQKWIQRKRKLNSAFIFFFLVSRVGNGAKLGIKYVLDHVRSISKEGLILQAISPSSLVEARKKIGWKIFRDLFSRVIEAFEENLSEKFLWKGHRIFAIDGTRINLPPELKEKKYKKYGKKHHYPVALVSTLYRLRAAMPYWSTFSRHLDERRDAKVLITHLKPNDVVVYDRGYFSLEMLSDHVSRKIDVVFRMQEGLLLPELVEFRQSGLKEKIVEIKRKKLTTMSVRILRYEIAGKSYFLLTTLTSKEKYSVKSLSGLYHERWGVEEQFKILKEYIKIESFSSKSTTGIRQELATFFCLLIYPIERLLTATT